jgi:ubiquitin-protein ligase
VGDVRTRRLQSDYDRVRGLVAASGGRLQLESASGTPPTEYIIVYHCRGLERLAGDRPVYRDTHRVRFVVPADYPGDPPRITVLTPVFHPHVYSTSVFCLRDHQRGDDFYRVNEFLDRLVLRIGYMLQYDPRFIADWSAANGEARDWFRANRSRLPLDHQTFGGGAEQSKSVVWKNV